MTEEIKEILYLQNYVDKYKSDEKAIIKGNRLTTPAMLDYLEVKDLLNYITNLQNEIEKLKDTIKKDNHLLGCNFSKKDKYKQERDIYKQRNEKAIEYIEKYLQEHIIDDLPDEESKFELENGTPIPNAKEILLNILQGGDE